MKRILNPVLAFLLILAPSFVNSSPLGQWITLDYKTHQPSGIVEIYESQGKLYGKIIKDLGVDTVKFCHHCPGDLNNKPVIGMTFLRDFKPTGHNSWTEGSIIDPHDGQVYKGSLFLTNQGKELKLRGYWGIFWRTDTWIRSKDVGLEQ